MLSHIRPLLDHRYALGQLLIQTPYEQRYEAYHVSLGIPVHVIALTPPPDERLADPEHFRNCALRAASLRHQALPRLRDFFTGDASFPSEKATWYTVFDPCEGAPFTDYLAHRRGRSLCEALVYGLQLCDALELVERQAPALLPQITLSPGTLRVCAYARIELLDLGVARWLMPALCRQVAPEESVYLAPEVLEGNAGDSRSKVYSIAAFLWHVLAGSPPAENANQNPDQSATPIPVALEAVIRQALDPATSRRYQSLDAFGRALGQAALQALPKAITLSENPISRSRMIH